MPFDPISWATGWLLGRAASKAWTRVFDDADVRGRLQGSLSRWADTIQAHGDFADFHSSALLEALFSPRDTEPQERMRDALMHQAGVPTTELIHAALIDSWLQVGAEFGDTAQSFFRIDQARAEEYLLDLAQSMYEGCFENAVQREIYEKTRTTDQNLDEVSRMTKQIYALLADKPKAKRQFDMPYFLRADPLTSRMTQTEDDLAQVLSLRRQYFESAVIVPDDAYRACWNREPDSMKIVTDPKGNDVGYWSILPVSADASQRFLAGRLTHEAMLRHEVLSWDVARTKPVHLYVVGIVVPNAGKFTSGRVILDMISFGVTLMERLDIAAVFGYPSRDAGTNTFQEMGFENTGVVVGDVADQTIFRISSEDGAAVARARQRFSALIRKQFPQVPVWWEADRSRFLRRIAGDAS